MNLDKSNDLLKKSKQLIPSITQTFSRAPSTFVEGIFPVYAEKASGCHFFDVDGNEFIDYLCGLGPIVLGYSNPIVNKAIKNQLEKGIIFSLPHKLEIETAELLCKMIPCADMVKFSKTGSGSATGAIRAARAITKRDKIAYCGTGGIWHDWYATIISRNKGIPSFNWDLILPFDYNDIDGLETIFEKNRGEISCVFMEPTLYENPSDSFLEKVKKIAKQNDAILIFDEIVTAPRFSNGGAQEYFHIEPDITVLGKGIANGMPLSAVVGKEEFMKIFDEIFFSTTFASETLSLAAAKATLTEFLEKPIVKKLWNTGLRFMTEFNKITKSELPNIEMVGYPVRLKLIGKDKHGKDSILVRSLLVQEMVKKGIFMHPTIGFVSYSHESEDIVKTMEILSESLPLIKKGLEENNIESLLEGKPAVVVYDVVKKFEKNN